MVQLLFKLFQWLLRRLNCCHMTHNSTPTSVSESTEYREVYMKTYALMLVIALATTF